MAGFLRGDERVRSQGVEFLNRLGRVVSGVGGDLPGDRAHVAGGLHHHGHGLLLVRRLVGGSGRHNHLVFAVHHRLAVVGLLEVLTSRPGMMRESG